MICSGIEETDIDRSSRTLAEERSTIWMDFKVSIDEHADTYSVVAVRGEVDLHTAPKVQYAIERGSEGVEAVASAITSTSTLPGKRLSQPGRLTAVEPSEPPHFA
jgi:hypothetical protein